MEENKTKLTPQKKQKIKRITSLVLIAALLITGAFAFLTATDSKTNVFTIGNIDIELWENFDPDRDGTPTTYDSSTKQPPKAEDLLPGEEVTKEPYVKNTGSNPAWTFLTVAVPCVDVDDITADANGHAAVAGNGVDYTVDIKAYGIQDKYGANTNTTAEAVWTAYAADIDGNATELSATDAADMRQIFTINGLDTTNWTQIGDVYKSSDGHFYYVYAYNTILPAEDDTSTDTVTENETTKLFTSVSLISVIGETAPVVVAYFAPVQPGSGSGTGAGAADISALLPTAPAGYELVHYDEVASGSSVGDLYWDSSLNKEKKDGKWLVYETRTELTPSTVINETTTVILEYEDINVVNSVPSEYFVYSDYFDTTTRTHSAVFMGIHSSFFEDRGSNAEYSIIIPDEITWPYIDIAGNDINGNPGTSFENMWGVDSASNNQRFIQTSSGYFYGSYFSEQTVPILGVAYCERPIGTAEQIDELEAAIGYDYTDPYSLGGIDTIVLGSNIEVVYKLNGMGTSGNTVEKLYFKNGVTTVCNLDKLPNLTSLNLPNTVKTIGYVNNCDSLRSLNYPDSVTSFDYIAWNDDLRSITITNKNALPKDYYNPDSTNIKTLPIYKGPLFYANPNLEEVTLPKVPVISGWSFPGDLSLSDIYFPGTIVEWLNTVVYYDHSDTDGSMIYTDGTGNAGSGYDYRNNEFIKGQVIVHCTDGDMEWNQSTNNWVPIN